MSEIKTAKQRIHKLEGGEGDSFVTVEQALIAERDELRAALADRDAKLSELHLQYISDFGQLQAQEPAAMYLRECADGSLVQLYDDLKPGTKLYAAAGAAPAPEGRKVTTTRIANHLKKSPLGDISMYRDGFFDGAKWAAKEQSCQNQ